MLQMLRSTASMENTCVWQLGGMESKTMPYCEDTGLIY